MLSLWCALVGIVKPTRRDGRPWIHPAGTAGSSRYSPRPKVSVSTGLKYQFVMRARRRHDAASGHRNVNAGVYLVNG